MRTSAPLELGRAAIAAPPVAVGGIGLGALLAGLFYHAGVAVWLVVAIAIVVAAAAIVVVTPRLARRVAGPRVAPRTRPVRAVAWTLLALLAVGNTARLAVFMVERDQVWASMFPPVQESAEHECLAAYVRAGELAAQQIDELYEDHHYAAAVPDEVPPTSQIDGLVDRLGDPYEYPPAFLTLPRAAIAATSDYQLIRTSWFGVQLVALAIVFVLACLWLGGAAGTRALALFPVLAVSFPTVACWQAGQFHLVALLCAVAGMLALARRKRAIGGGLLGFAIASKIFPGLLLVYLAARRDGTAITWTLAAALAWTALAVLVVGVGPLHDFVLQQLPGLAADRAMAFTEGNPDNYAPYALFYKLDTLGVPAGHGVGAALAWVWTAIAVVAAVLLGRAPAAGRRVQLLAWLALLTIAGLRSPFAPIYTGVAQLWVLTVLATWPSRPLRTALIVTAIVLLQGFPPVFGPAVNVLASLPGQLVALSVPLWAVAACLRDPAGSVAPAAQETASPP